MWGSESRIEKRETGYAAEYKEEHFSQERLQLHLIFLMKGTEKGHRNLMS